VKKRARPAVVRALEEARYGPNGLLNLRDSMPTGEQAKLRAESWLRERQVMGITDAVIITGRGAGSPGGIAVVREGVRTTLNSLKRRGVVDGFSENGPGSFAVKVAPLKRLFEAARRKRETRTAEASQSGGETVHNPASLAGLSSELMQLLRKLATASLRSLGVSGSESLVESEMIRQFSILSKAVATGPDRERLFTDAVRRALGEYDES
jgi:hypothetical protein